jgi:hypothetical protein
MWGLQSEASPGKQFKRPPSPKITRAKMDWMCGSGSRASTLQAWSTEFKPLSHPPIKKKIKKLMKRKSYSK